MIPDMIQEFFIDTMKNSFLDENFSMVSSATLDTMKKFFLGTLDIIKNSYHTLWGTKQDKLIACLLWCKKNFSCSVW